jgi:hypothetical protein
MMKISDLNKHYEAADTCDKEIFAEMRSNLLLVSGNHYDKKTSTFFSRIRNSQRLNDSAKLRLTKNHIHKITRHYINSITAKVPGVAVRPQNELEVQDRKAAQLNQAVWADGHKRYNFKEKFREFAEYFVEIGEVHCFMYFDPNKGDVIGYEPMVDESGQPVVDMMTGEMMPDESKPVFSGSFEFKNVPGFNLLRSPNAKTIKDSPYLIMREMVDQEELLAAYGEDESKRKVIGEGDTEDFTVFDTNKQSYEKSDKQVLVRYHFFRPSRKFPKGAFAICTDRGILEQGEIPFGIFPIISEGFDTFATHPRAFSIIRVARPYQAEINRAASQAATHAVTVGEDKIIYQAGTKLAPGALLPGVRGLTYQGAAPQILPGRPGDQFLPQIEQNIREMYQACMLDEVLLEKESGQVDPYSLLFRSASAQAKFSRYIQKFESFLKQFCQTYLELCRHYLPEEAVIQAIGKAEAINIQEFKSTQALSYLISVEEQTEALDEKMGRQIALNHVLQYVGNQLDTKQIGMILKEMPFLNNKTLFQRLSIDFDNAENDILALERGTMPFISPYCDNQVFIDAVTHRMKQADFQMLSPEIQGIFEQYLTYHEAEMERKAEAMQAAKDGFIPSGGALITCSMQIADPSTSSGTRQVRLPYEALMWLIKRLDAQGSSLNSLEQMNPGVVAQMNQSPQADQIPAIPGM